MYLTRNLSEEDRKKFLVIKEKFEKPRETEVKSCLFEVQVPR